MNRKTILLTGASKGIGYDTALELASRGHTVITVARSFHMLEELEQRYPENIEPHRVDLTNNREIEALADRLGRGSAGIDIVIHNAGDLTNKPFAGLSDEDWTYLIDANLLSAVRLVRNLLPLMKSGSHIVNISSMGGYQGSTKFPGLSAYSTTKGALTILTECLAVELREKKISANCLCLGAVQTDMLKAAFPGLEAPVTSAEMAGYIAGFSLEGHKFYNGRILPVALGDPG